MKKLLAICTATLLIIALAAGCASGTSESPSPNNSNSPASNSPSPGDPATGGGETEQVTVKLGIYPADTETDLKAVEDKFIATFHDKYPDAKIVPSYYKYATDNFVPMAEAGTVPTIFETWYTEPLKLVKAGYVRDITPFLDARGWTDYIAPAVKSQLSVDGKIYGIPRDGYGLGLFCSVELFTEAGLVNADGTLQYPKTWAELAETAKTLREKTGARGLCLLAGEDLGADGWHFSNIAWDYGAFGNNALVKDNGDGSWSSNLNSQSVIDAMNYVKSLKWEYDALSEDPTSEGWATGWAAIAAGTSGMYIGAADGVSQFANNGLSPDGIFYAPLPAGPGGQFALQGGSLYMFPNNATDAEINAAIDYLVIRGRTPVMTEDAEASLRAGWEENKANNIAVVPPVFAWDSPELKSATEKAIAEYLNVDMKMWPYYDSINDMLKPEEPAGGQVQAMYKELGKIVQEVVTNKDADVKALLDTANTNLQAILDNPPAE
ncbi:sugar ABC transporter substrate-binding protein [Clostridia bacterium]|nr:sugar ABC transporter substrate-binding protein [Clostridia bacterium]